jgi:molybdate transport system substrate-binding protein
VTTGASPIRIICTMGLRGVMTDVAATLAEGGHHFDAAYGATKLLMDRMAKGETADVGILIDSAIDELALSGIMVTGSRRDLARSGIGLAVRAGARKPDISTVAAFKQALLAARSVGYSKSGASGLHFAHLIVELGIADDINRKAKVQDGVVGEFAAKGEVEIAIQQISELKLVDGIDIVGPLPDGLQKETVFSAGVFAATPRRADAEAFIAALRSREVAVVMREKGLEPLAAVV